MKGKFQTITKKSLSLFIALIMIVSILPAETFTANAATLTLSQLKAKFPEGKYWNGGNADSYTSKACTCHGTGVCLNGTSPCTCNHFLGGTQCFGFALKLGYDAYGSNPRNWSKAYNLNNVKPGDIINYQGEGHTVFVIGVNGDTVSFAECNWKYRCIISWSRSLKKSEFTNLLNVYVAPSSLTTGTHTHSYSGSYFEAAHPHKVYQKCSCGAIQYTGATKAISSCSTCMKLSDSYVAPCKAYTIATGKTTVYSSVGGTAKTNKIYDTDLCTISQIYDCGWCKVTFPLDAGGTETGYCKISVFLKGSGFEMTTSKQLTTYKRSDLSSSLGNAGSGDKIYVLGNTSTAVQIAFPLSSGGYKVGWTPISNIKGTIAYNPNGGSGSMSSSTVQYKNTFTLADNKYTKTGYTFSGWNCYRTSDKTWYTKSNGWKTASQITSNEYEKYTYKNQFSDTFTGAWVKGSKTNDTFTFYPVWTANTLSVYYNSNGGTITSNTDTYSISSKIIYKNGSKYVQKWTYNEAKSNGLANASSFGLTREGYTFSGWGTTSSGGTIFDQNDSTLVPTSINSSIKNGSCSTTVYAIWTPKTYTVKYDANGGTNAPSSQTKTHGTALILSKTTPIKDGFEFIGWSKTKGATTASYSAGASYTENSAVTLYAVWKQIDQAAVHTHEWDTEYTIDIEPTCTESGTKSIHCRTCEATKNTEIVSATGHITTEQVLRDATCNEPGIKAMVCSVCDEEISSVEIPIKNHNYVSTVISEATCNTEGLMQDVCTECDLHTNSKAIPVLDHSFTEWELEIEPTSSHDGLEIRRCINCDYEETREIDYIPVYDENSPRFVVDTVKAVAGEEVTVNIRIENNVGVTALRLIVDYNDAVLEMKDFKFGEALSEMSKGTSAEFSTPYAFSMYSATKDISDNGVIATITFRVNENAETGEYPINITYDKDDVFNLNGDSIDFDIETGYIMIDTCMLGDLNNDGKINMRDVVLLQQVINGWNVEYNSTAADYNCDGKINMRDIVALQQYING